MRTRRHLAIFWHVCCPSGFLAPKLTVFGWYRTSCYMAACAARPPTQVLLIGCGDIRNALASLATTKATGRLQLHLNDANPSRLALSSYAPQQLLAMPALHSSVTCD